MLSLQEICFRYRKDSEELFQGLSHEFAPRAVTVLTGESGRGKSTLLYILGMMLRPTSGSVTIEGVSVSGLPDAARSRLRAQDLGFVFQDSVLDKNRTILDAVVEPALYAGNKRRLVVKRAVNLLTDLGVEQRATHLPGAISGGQAQRVAVCRALMNRPRAILADEPTGNLDRSNAAAVLAALATAAARGCTVVIASHDPFVVERGDAVLRL